jgi:hypothetical protein
MGWSYLPCSVGGGVPEELWTRYCFESCTGSAKCSAKRALMVSHWKKDLSDFFKAHGRTVEVPADFPQPEDLNSYESPLVSLSS